ncbi:hypothetical protein EDD15DRAFT_1016922 [Pisolithus albus]|nr:hypothetical protein EDD15DRAFT_1016922 [Pisolithus albus]
MHCCQDPELCVRDVQGIRAERVGGGGFRADDSECWSGTDTIFVARSQRSNSTIIPTQSTSNSTSIRVRNQLQRDSRRRRFHVYAWVPWMRSPILESTRAYLKSVTLLANSRPTARAPPGPRTRCLGYSNPHAASLKLSSPPVQLSPMSLYRGTEAAYQLQNLPSFLRRNLTRQRSLPCPHLYICLSKPIPIRLHHLPHQNSLLKVHPKPSRMTKRRSLKWPTS